MHQKIVVKISACHIPLLFLYSGSCKVSICVRDCIDLTDEANIYHDLKQRYDVEILQEPRNLSSNELNLLEIVMST
eukprot:snap_masked-scaffold_1-processed-gene-24.40-mRNA-1 protein AED:1.00 eAED:1.00 QI:0/-1/0/0/-1/1/1/0/75